MQESQPNSRVKVAIRVRPFIAKEIADTEQSCVRTVDKSQIILGRDREFKFDRVFDHNSSQQSVYNECIHELVMRCFDGYNAAVLAYGQTGSGKTYTMGTSHGYASSDEELGVLPRVINSLFQEIHRRQDKATFSVRASFLEIYNEQINDLLCSEVKTKGRAAPAVIQDKGNISIVGLTQEPVQCTAQLMALLEKGALQRSTSSTLMNDTSSRSHAIFTINVKQEMIVDGNSQKQQGCITSKFHFVDLAGSERIKKTGATGSTLRQGININMGLLCLGNVINALTNPESKNNFVPYRDSKLTRILQDSLGGNSNTYMIACVSPAESNYEESSSTLRYAARAMNIKNKPVVNRDPQSALIAQLRQQLTILLADNQKMKAIMKENGLKVDDAADFSQIAQVIAPNFSPASSQQLQEMRTANQNLQKKIEHLQQEMMKDRKRLNEAQIQVLEMRRDRDILRLKLDDIIRENPQLKIPDLKAKTDTLDSYLQTIQQLKNEISDKEKLNQQLQNEYQQLLATSKRDEELLVMTTKENYKLKKQVIQLFTMKNRATTMSDYRESHTPYDESAMPSMDMSKMEPTLDDIHLEEQDDNYVNKQKQFENQTQMTQAQITHMNVAINEKEKLLRDMTNNQIDLEYRLITDMKEEYHHKISQLEKEKQKLQKQMQMISQKNATSKDDNKDRLVVSLRTKRDSLELQLKEYKKKERQQQHLEKMVSAQKLKIKELSNEIKGFKTQKMELNRKLKEDKEMFDRFKLERLKEVLEMRKKNIEKDNHIRKLTMENRKNQQSALKKDEQARRLRRVNETLKEILEPKKHLQHPKRGTVMPHLQHQQQEKQDKPDNINYEQLVHQIVYKLMCQADLQAQISRYEQESQAIEKQLEKYLQKDTKLKLQIERLKVKKDHFPKQIDEATAKMEQCKIKLSQTSLTIQSLQQNLQYTRSRYQNVIQGEVRKFDVETELIYNKQYDSMDSMRKIVVALLSKFMNLLRQQVREREISNQLKQEIGVLKNSLEEKEQQLQISNNQYIESLARLRQEMLIHSAFANNQEQQTSDIGQTATKTVRTDDKGDRKVLERKVNDLNKKVKQLTMELDQSKRKCEVVSQKYESIKKIGNKDKFVGRVTSRDDEQKIATYSQKRAERNTTLPQQTMQQNTVILEEVTSMMQNLSNQQQNSSLTLKHNLSEKDQTGPSQTAEDTFQGNYFWECISTFEGHSNPVLSLTCHSNMLISTSTKSLKLWDLETNKIISDLTGNYLNGFVKCVVVEPERRIMVTACDKAITLWDLVSLQVISTLKAHKDQVRVLHLANDTLFSAGKGGPSASSIFSWDFRTMSMMQEAERAQDIFSLSSHKGILYYGSRNHQVRRLNIENMEVLAPFDPPHFDTVTCLTTLGDYLISGSKDKNLKLWSTDSAVKNLRATSYAHNDYVNTIQAGDDYPIFYSGSRNGQVKVGTIIKQKLEFLGNIDCHTQSVNSLCIIQDTASSIFATGSSDKTIKLWRPTSDTQGLLQSDQFYLGQ